VTPDLRESVVRSAPNAIENVHKEPLVLKKTFLYFYHFIPFLSLSATSTVRIARNQCLLVMQKSRNLLRFYVHFSYFLELNYAIVKLFSTHCIAIVLVK